ncbi:aryl-sulfate sulfotransferase [Chitinophaga ginsengisegetis]|uniref:aryl-sulfate sulfotransferase n=1 Tax=Chitinophaga ginsengisegetis TaxID=393003 RepID=UPI000DB90B8F|nr:aryl-sulfate sulfotransferase [Chitinophaga ginsengisegetis]MDR6568916.1 DNA-binding beta-propeller fold protein YncE [Chitinophaga ginsengisegetis]MDR6649055.1 DNA-binding beta-propeller fold protein YncE [Chitinophaga ginsengisegetis]MDR6654997.1 DNA-binding beta-propeller fold protein YncE [Chitinophaga ginsengisegetis]
MRIHHYFLLILCACAVACHQPPQKKPLPFWVQDAFNLDSMPQAQLPARFKEGYVLLSQRDEPGALYLLNSQGKVVWYHQVKGTGFKTAHFTENKTLLCILGSKEYATSYGNQVMELSMTGDTLLHLQKGQADFTANVHHEVLLAPDNHIVMLATVERTFDLTTAGGTAHDTVRSDGILVLDRKGHKVWEWSVFDALEPATDKEILHTRMDWMHANSLSYDKDGNYLISFYNNGQIWKLDAHTGKVIWKFGKNGDFRFPDSAAFDMGHAVHINAENDLMLFDNGVSRQQSQTLAFHLDEGNRTAAVSIRSPLPAYLFNDRMGSAYLVDHNSILQCSSKRNTVLLTNRQGHPLWRLRCSFIPYRAEFIPKEKLSL